MFPVGKFLPGVQRFLPALDLGPGTKSRQGLPLENSGSTIETMTQTKRCPITGQEMRPLFKHQVLGRYEVEYFFSDQSGLIQTQEPFWLEEAYQAVISELDTWVGLRNVTNARRLEAMLALLFPADAVFVDVACGYGILTRLLRDIGFSAFGHDKYCANIFAKPFEPSPNTRASAICTFEVLEHLMDPVQFLSEEMKRYQTDTVIASTTLFDGAIPGFDWPYYSFESGQHLSFYQPRTLDLVARALGCRYFRLPWDYHLITRRPVAAWQLFLLRTRSIRKAHALLTRWRRRRRSFTLADYEMLRSKVLEKGKNPGPTAPGAGLKS
jgi:hypothetical protein